MKTEKGNKILVTGGAGFIGSCLVLKLLKEVDNKILNVDKLSYASDLTSISKKIQFNKELASRYEFIKLDLNNCQETFEAVKNFKPDIIFHLAAESHVDRSIDNPSETIKSNIIGTFNLLEAARKYWNRLNQDKQNSFRFIHISTDEVFGSLDSEGFFNEITRYDPQSPYSASKASSDHLVKAWHGTYGLPTIITNCSNNFGPWQFPEKFIPTIILKSIKNEEIPIYGEGKNIRDWLFVEDHIDALILISKNGKPGLNYCIGGNNEITNLKLVNIICEILDQLKSKKTSYKNQISFVEDRPGHDFRYAINTEFISKELLWKPKYNFDEAIKITIEWYLNNINWCNSVMENSSFFGQRLGINK